MICQLVQGHLEPPSVDSTFRVHPPGIFNNNVTYQGRRKQSVDGQAQLDVGGEDANNSRAKCAAKFWTSLFLAVRRRSHCILQASLEV